MGGRESLQSGHGFEDFGQQLIHAVDVFTREVLGKVSSTERSPFAPQSFRGVISPPVMSALCFVGRVESDMSGPEVPPFFLLLP